MASIPLTLEAAGTALDVAGQIRAGESAYAAGKFEKKQLEQAAGKRRAASQRKAQDIDRQGRLQQSRALAVAASSGSGASDPTIINYMAQLAGETNYRKMLAVYEGEEEAAGLELEGKVRKAEGKSRMRSSGIGAIGTALSGGASLYEKYGER